jgi:hypothetical protein
LNFFQDGIFIAPKTYGLKTNDNEIIKIKGIQNSNISLSELKFKFYSNESILFQDEFNSYKTNFSLNRFCVNKEIFLHNYDKRIFLNNKKSTIPTDE